MLTLSTCPQVPQVARGLAERVLSNSASKLKKYLTEAVKLSGVSLDKYSKIVASICEGTFSALQHDQLVENEKEVSLLMCLFTQPDLFLTRFFFVELPHLLVVQLHYMLLYRSPIILTCRIVKVI